MQYLWSTRRFVEIGNILMWNAVDDATKLSRFTTSHNRDGKHPFEIFIADDKESRVVFFFVALAEASFHSTKRITLQIIRFFFSKFFSHVSLAFVYCMTFNLERRREIFRNRKLNHEKIMRNKKCTSPIYVERIQENWKSSLRELKLAASWLWSDNYFRIPQIVSGDEITSVPSADVNHCSTYKL